MNGTRSISKILSPNDVGLTGAHQAGILIPKKDERILSFFPRLDRNEKNPRRVLEFRDREGSRWKFNFIYYNNLYFEGTRNEYRLTGMTKFFSAYALTAGDEVILTRYPDTTYTIDYRKSGDTTGDPPGGKPGMPPDVKPGDRKVLILGTRWRTISI